MEALEPVKSSHWQGVSFSPSGKWRGELLYMGKSTFLGEYETEDDAARAVDKALVHKSGWTAQTNFPIEDYQNEVSQLRAMSMDDVILHLQPQSKRTISLESGYLGVTATATGKWQAHISFAGKQVFLGQYSTKEEAAKAYDRAAIVKAEKEGTAPQTNFEVAYYGWEVAPLKAMSMEQLAALLVDQSKMLAERKMLAYSNGRMGAPTHNPANATNGKRTADFDTPRQQHTNSHGESPASNPSHAAPNLDEAGPTSNKRPKLEADEEPASQSANASHVLEGAGASEGKNGMSWEGPKNVAATAAPLAAQQQEDLQPSSSAAAAHQDSSRSLKPATPAQDAHAKAEGSASSMPGATPSQQQQQQQRPSVTSGTPQQQQRMLQPVPAGTFHVAGPPGIKGLQPLVISGSAPPPSGAGPMASAGFPHVILPQMGTVQVLGPMSAMAQHHGDLPRRAAPITTPGPATAPRLPLPSSIHLPQPTTAVAFEHDSSFDSARRSHGNTASAMSAFNALHALNSSNAQAVGAPPGSGPSSPLKRKAPGNMGPPLTVTVGVHRDRDRDRDRDDNAPASATSRQGNGSHNRGNHQNGTDLIRSDSGPLSPASGPLKSPPTHSVGSGSLLPTFGPPNHLTDKRGSTSGMGPPPMRPPYAYPPGISGMPPGMAGQQFVFAPGHPASAAGGRKDGVQVLFEQHPQLAQLGLPPMPGHGHPHGRPPPLHPGHHAHPSLHPMPPGTASLGTYTLQPGPGGKGQAGVPGSGSYENGFGPSLASIGPHQLGGGNNPLLMQMVKGGTPYMINPAILMNPGIANALGGHFYTGMVPAGASISNLSYNNRPDLAAIIAQQQHQLQQQAAAAASARDGSPRAGGPSSSNGGGGSGGGAGTSSIKPGGGSRPGGMGSPVRGSPPHNSFAGRSGPPIGRSGPSSSSHKVVQHIIHNPPQYMRAIRNGIATRHVQHRRDVRAGPTRRVVHVVAGRDGREGREGRDSRRRRRPTEAMSDEELEEQEEHESDVEQEGSGDLVEDEEVDLEAPIARRRRSRRRLRLASSSRIRAILREIGMGASSANQGAAAATGRPSRRRGGSSTAGEGSDSGDHESNGSSGEDEEQSESEGLPVPRHTTRSGRVTKRSAVLAAAAKAEASGDSEHNGRGREDHKPAFVRDSRQGHSFTAAGSKQQGRGATINGHEAGKKPAPPPAAAAPATPAPPPPPQPPMLVSSKSRRKGGAPSRAAD